jgi:hypothetical protein
VVGFVTPGLKVIVSDRRNDLAILLRFFRSFFRNTLERLWSVSGTRLSNVAFHGSCTDYQARHITSLTGPIRPNRWHASTWRNVATRRTRQHARKSA